jgi:hypothetical protein
MQEPTVVETESTTAATTSATKAQPEEDNPLEFYKTPEWVTDIALRRLALSAFRRPLRFLDPAAGDGAILSRLRDLVHPDSTFHAIELDADRAKMCSDLGFQTLQGDAFALAWPEVDVVIINPPFSYSLEFLQKAFYLWKAGNIETVAFFSRMAVLETPTRSTWIREHMPNRISAIPTRITFEVREGSKATTAQWQHIWMFWDPPLGGGLGEAQQLSQLEIVPTAECTQRLVQKKKAPRRSRKTVEGT